MSEKIKVNKDRTEMINGELEKSGSSSIKNPGLVIKLMDPFVFDGTEVTELDLNGLYELTARDIIAIDDVMLRNGYSGQNMELLNRYAVLAAARAMKKPWEYLDNMKSRDVIRLKNIVSGFFYMRTYR